MVYTIEFEVDGGCRRGASGYMTAVAAAARKNRNGRYTKAWVTNKLADDVYEATSQRAELSAIILALKQAIAEADTLAYDPFVYVVIRTDSKYALGCMTTWLDKWMDNGWMNARGNPVANRDLIEKAVDLQDQLSHGEVEYIWIPRSENEYADSLCTAKLDQIDDDYDSFNDSDY